MMIRITPRDKEIFEFLFKHGFATAQQVHTAVFEDESAMAAYVRLFKLFSDGYLIRIYGERVIYRLTKKALLALNKSLDEIDHYLKRNVIKDQLIHDLTVID